MNGRPVRHGMGEPEQPVPRKLVRHVEVAHFTGLSLRGKPVSTSVEGFVHAHNGHPSMAQRAVSLLKDGLVGMGYFESRLLRWMPGGGGHFTAIAAVG